MGDNNPVKVHDPDATEDFDIDWATALSTDTVATSTWTLDSGITESTNSFSTTATKLWVAGGTAGTTYRAVNEITTAAGRTLQQSLWLACLEK